MTIHTQTRAALNLLRHLETNQMNGTTLAKQREQARRVAGGGAGNRGKDGTVMPTKTNRDSPITPRQRQLLDFIRSYVAAHGFPPSIREIGVAMDIRSPNGILCHLRALEKRGVLRRAKVNGRHVARTFEVVGDAAMSETKPNVDQIIAAVAEKFRCFGKGAGRVTGNPIAAAMEDKPPMFAAGVDVGDVVRFVIEKAGR